MPLYARSPAVDLDGRSELISNYYKPRHKLVLTVPIFGSTSEKSEQARGLDTKNITVLLKRSAWEVNDANTADSLSISGDWRDIGVDPRLIKHATGQYYIWDANINEDPLPTDMCFLGVVSHCRRHARSGSGFDVDIEMVDYTDFFLRNKLVPAGIPGFGETLRQAWAKICDYTGWPSVDEQKIISNVAIFRDRLDMQGLEAVGIDESTTIGSKAPDRIKKLMNAKFPDKATSWDVWKTICSWLGLITFIDADKCVLRTTTDHYRSESAPILLWGKNIEELEERGEGKVTDKGLCLSSYDPLKGEIIESFYPPVSDPRVKKKQNKARKGISQEQQDLRELNSANYEFMEYHYAVTQEQLDLACQTGYEERARQEIDGRISTADMLGETADGVLFDFRRLRAGDAVAIKIDPYDHEMLTSLGSTEARISYLLDKGYEPDVAELIEANLEAFASLKSVFHIKKVVHQLEESSFKLEIFYHNLIDLTGHVVEVAEDLAQGQGQSQ